jgi:hypothetical protein
MSIADLIFYSCGIIIAHCTIERAINKPLQHEETKMTRYPIVTSRPNNRRTTLSYYCCGKRIFLTLLFLLWIFQRIVQSLQALPVVTSSMEEESFPLLPPPSNHHHLKKNHSENILLYITTHFSDQHVRYFHCCWPKLVTESPLISSAHILIAATNSTPVSETELEYLSDLFSHNPSYQFRPLPSDEMTKCDRYKNESVRGNNPLKKPVNYKQCLANQGVQVGFQHGWVYNTSRTLISSSGSNAHQHQSSSSVTFDWMIRINPDVLIRKSSWLLETMMSSQVQGIFAICNTRQLHTDFFAVRPSSLLGTNTTSSSLLFSKMGIKANKLNHERTAYREFKHMLQDNDKHRLLPDVDPSEGSCRVRGESASVYHVHDSCLEPSNDGGDDGNLHCNALDGWDLGKQ